MRITGLTPSEKIPERYYAAFEDGTKLAVSISHIADYSLFTGKELDEDEFEELKEASSLYLARSKSLKLLELRPMSRCELIRKLTEKGITPTAAEAAADAMERIGALNDREYAFMLVRRYAAKGYGAGRVRDELRARGIARELWEPALETMPKQDETVDKLVRSKLRGQKPDRAALKKLSDSLHRRGFSWDEISPAIERYMEEIGED